MGSAVPSRGTPPVEVLFLSPSRCLLLLQWDCPATSITRPRCATGKILSSTSTAFPPSTPRPAAPTTTTTTTRTSSPASCERPARTLGGGGDRAGPTRIDVTCTLIALVVHESLSEAATGAAFSGPRSSQGARSSPRTNPAWGVGPPCRRRWRKPDRAPLSRRAP